MNEYPEKLQNVIDELSLIENPQDRMEFLIDYADKFKEVPESVAKRPFPAETKVPFCESEAYVFAVPEDDGGIKYYYAVDNPNGVSAKALAQIFSSTLQGVKPEDILRIPLDVIYKIFGQSLSMGKNMGLTGILQMMKRDAKKFMEEKNQLKNLKQQSLSQNILFSSPPERGQGEVQ
jgi:cysteine desulfuration protein SufE